MGVKLQGIVLADPLGELYIEIGEAANREEVKEFLSANAHQEVQLLISTAEELQIAAEAERKRLEAQPKPWETGEVPLALPAAEASEAKPKPKRARRKAQGGTS